jgi:ribonuclease-3
MVEKYKEFESVIKYTFKNINYLSTALTHSSFSNENKNSPSYERLEFLGDTVLELAVSTNLFKIFPDMDEGMLTKIRSEIVREENLAKFARKLSIDKYVNLGKSEILVHGEKNDSIMCDCFESLIGAIYLDSDYNTVDSWINNIIKPSTYSTYVNKNSDSKSKLIEYSKKKGVKLAFELLSQSGPAHNKLFKIAVAINDKVISTGCGASKKKAEQEASLKALKKLRD